MANIQSEIKDLQEAINSPATPEAQKVVMRGILAKLESKQGSQKSTSKPPVDLSTQKGRNNYLKKPKGADDSDKDLNKRVFAYLSKKHPQYTDELLTNNKGKELNTKALISWYPEQSIKDAYKIVAKKDTTPKGIEVDFEFIEKYTPDYYTNSNVTMSDDLAKFIDGEMNDEDYQDTIVSEFGEIDVKEAKKLASEIDQELMLNAIEEYEEQTGKKYTKTKTLVSVDGKSKLNIKVPNMDLNDKSHLEDVEERLMEDSSNEQATKEEIKAFMSKHKSMIIELGRKGYNPFDTIYIIQGDFEETDNPEKAIKDYNKIVATKFIKDDTKKSDTLGDYNCDELIEKEKAKAKKRKANALKKANEPKKTEATKNKERIERVADVVETNLEKRLAKNEVSVEEIRKLIDETESLLTKLKEALKKAH